MPNQPKHQFASQRLKRALRFLEVLWQHAPIILAVLEVLLYFTLIAEA
jgi:hypothetical protein